MTTTYLKDLGWRVLATAGFSGLGVAVTGLNDSHVWYVLPIAAVLSVVGGKFQKAPTPSGFVHALERGGWTLAEVAVSAVVVTALPVPVEYMPLISAGLSLVKGVIARHIGDPDSAASLPAAA